MPAVLGDPRWEIACQHLAKGQSKVDAYAAAGFARNAPAASKFFSRPLIAERCRELLEQRAKVEQRGSEIAAKKVGLSKEWVIERLMYNAERCLRGQPVLDANGVHTGKFTGKPDANGANRALHLLGLEVGMFVQRTEIGGPGDFDRLTLDELEVKAREMQAALWPGSAPGVAGKRMN